MQWDLCWIKSKPINLIIKNIYKNCALRKEEECPLVSHWADTRIFQRLTLVTESKGLIWLIYRTISNLGKHHKMRIGWTYREIQFQCFLTVCFRGLTCRTASETRTPTCLTFMKTIDRLLLYYIKFDFIMIKWTRLQLSMLPTIAIEADHAI